jgi:hypothetical protein
MDRHDCMTADAVPGNVNVNRSWVLVPRFLALLL